MAERKDQENFELDKSFQEFNSDGGLSLGGGGGGTSIVK